MSVISSSIICFFFYNETIDFQNKQSPVEELLRQADQLIATQKPRAEVYAAMAESLGRAWKDINFNLELRKVILDLNVQYHTKAQEFFDKMDELEASCKDTVVPIEIDAVKNFLTSIHDLRRALLESLMGALQTGNSLLAKLKELGAEGTLDSRPDRIRSSVNRGKLRIEKTSKSNGINLKIFNVLDTDPCFKICTVLQYRRAAAVRKSRMRVVHLYFLAAYRHNNKKNFLIHFLSSYLTCFTCSEVLSVTYS